MNIRTETHNPPRTVNVIAHGRDGYFEPDVTVFLAGELDIYSAPTVASALDKEIKGGARDLLVDLSDVHYVDMGGLGALIRALKQIQAYGGSILLAGADAGITRILNVTGLVRIFRIYDRDRATRDGDAA